MTHTSTLSGKRKLGNPMESDDDRESEDAKFMAIREARSHRNGILMSEDEAFKFFVRGPAGMLKDHSNMAHCVAKQQLYFCQQAMVQLLKEIDNFDPNLFRDLGVIHGLDQRFMEGVKAGARAALERIKGG